jgi:hypothetical protein
MFDIFTITLVTQTPVRRIYVNTQSTARAVWCVAKSKVCFGRYSPCPTVNPGYHNHKTRTTMFHTKYGTCTVTLRVRGPQAIRPCDAKKNFKSKNWTRKFPPSRYLRVLQSSRISHLLHIRVLCSHLSALLVHVPCTLYV